MSYSGALKQYGKEERDHVVGSETAPDETDTGRRRPSLPSIYNPDPTYGSQLNEMYKVELEKNFEIALINIHKKRKRK